MIQILNIQDLKFIKGDIIKIDASKSYDEESIFIERNFISKITFSWDCMDSLKFDCSIYSDNILTIKPEQYLQSLNENISQIYVKLTIMNDTKIKSQIIPITIVSSLSITDSISIIPTVKSD